MSRRKTKKLAVIALFGSVQMERGYCLLCKSTAFIKDGCFVCCGSIADRKPDKFQRESELSQRRKLPSREEQEQILADQDYSCFYCGASFGSIHTRRNEQLILKITWDHKFPFSWFGDNRPSNFVAACQICNGIKHDMVFPDLTEAQVYLALKRKQKGYDF